MVVVNLYRRSKREGSLLESVILKLEINGRPWHDVQAIALARAITRANQEKGGLAGQEKLALI